ncbi:putative transposase [Novosphingobium sp. PhB57]|nr:putative transposase [Novosphingobium sp. PhB57]
MFGFKDYHGDGTERQQVMTLASEDLFRRFLIHVLPRGFHRVRQGSPCNITEVIPSRPIRNVRPRHGPDQHGAHCIPDQGANAA